MFPYLLWYLISHSPVDNSCFPSITVGPPDVTVGGPAPTSVRLFWEVLPTVTRYEVSFVRSSAEGSQDRHTQCGSVTHEGTIDVGTATEYTLNGLEEDSMYTITVTAVYTGGSSPSDPQVTTTRQAGNIILFLSTTHGVVYSTVIHYFSSFSPNCSSSECQRHRYQLNYYHCGMGWC